MISDQSNSHVFRRYLKYLPGIGLVYAGVACYLVKIVNADIIRGAFILHDIVLPEKSAYLLSYFPARYCFDN